MRRSTSSKECSRWRWAVKQSAPPPGAVVLAPKGTLHALASAGSDAARFLVILSPPGYEGFWREMGELRAAGGPDGAPPSAELVLALRRKYHLATGGEVRRFD